MKYKITPLSKIKQDARGEVFEFNLAGKKNFLFLSIKKGFTRGDHYHLGKTKSKNPENLFLICGKVKLIFSEINNINGKNKKTVVISKPSHIQIWPNTYHSLVAMEDSWIFEANTAKANPKDTIKLFE